MTTTGVALVCCVFSLVAGVGMAATSLTPDGLTSNGTTATDGSAPISSSSSSSVFGAGTDLSMTSGSGTSGSVPYDLKSPDNPHWVSFLEQVARQTSWDMADLQANGANDASIGFMWDVYVQTIGDGTALPSSSSSSSSSSSGTQDQTAMSGSPSSGGPVMALYEGGGQVDTSGTAPATSSSSSSPTSPQTSDTWFQSFFKDPALAAQGNQMVNTFSGGSTTGSDAGTAASAGPTFNTNFGSMDQMFSQFRRPTAQHTHAPYHHYPQTQGQYPQTQGQYPQTQGQYPQTQASQQQTSLDPTILGMTSEELARRFYSLASPLVMQSLTGQQQQQPATTYQQPQQQTSNFQKAPSASLPDAGWGISSQTPTQQQQQPSPISLQVLPPLNDASLQQLSNELMSLLGKTPTYPPPPPADTSNTAPWSSSSGQPQPPPVPTTTPAPPPPPQPSNPGTEAVAAASNFINKLLLHAPTNQVAPGNTAPAGLKLDSIIPMDLLPPVAAPPSRLQLLKPVVNFYNAKHNAGASRDLGCRTLGEMLDMDVPRPVDLNCNRLCPALMPGAVTGKRFGLTCLCCPLYVSDQAIGMRSMLRRAESLA